jgi:3',5'-cyclic-AMP phosphodiesterase
VAALAAAVESLQGVRPAPDAVLVSGDLAENAADSEYEQVIELLAPLRAHIFVVPGNHDARSALRRHFDVPGAGDEPVQYVADLGPLRLVVIDTTRPGEDAGALDEERLSWLDAELAAEPGVPTVIAMHHPPIVTGMAPWDAIGLPVDHCHALGDVVTRHSQVRRIVTGHMHSPIAAELAGRVVLAAPSTYMQARLDLLSKELELVPGPAAFALHVLRDGDLISYVQRVH